MTSLLEARGLRRHYGERLVVDIETLTLARGEIVALLGPNGAGKSTLFRILLRLESVSRGEVRLNGEPLRVGDPKARGRLAGVFQRPHLFAGTVFDNLAFALRAAGRSRRDIDVRVRELAQLLGVSQQLSRSVGSLSGGEAQRVALGRALATSPDVLLLDEPMANLDPATRDRLREDVERLARAQAGAVLLITHDPLDAFGLADRVVVMEQGRIVQHGTPDELVLEPVTPFVAAITGAQLLLDGQVERIEQGITAVRLRGGARLEIVHTAGQALDPGTPVHVAYRPEDVVVAPPQAPATSARNRFDVRVTAVIPMAGVVRVKLMGDIALVATVTRQSASELELRPGASATAQLKAAALRIFPAGSGMAGVRGSSP
ncbi:MAG: ABC transporter ATP-binding protein [Longimicrobiales bacterium]